MLQQYRKGNPWNISMCDHWQHTIGDNNQWGCGHIVPIFTVHHAFTNVGYTFIQAWSKTVHNWLFIPKEPYKNRDQEIPSMNINMHAIITAWNIPICTSLEDIQVATWQDADLQRLQSYKICGWPYIKGEVEKTCRSTGQSGISCNDQWYCNERQKNN